MISTRKLHISNPIQVSTGYSYSSTSALQLCALRLSLNFTHSGFHAQAGSACCVDFSPDGQFVAAGYQSSEIKIWSVASCECKAILKGHTGK